VNNKNLKILIINNGYPSQNNPQYSTYIKTIRECLQDAGLSTDLLVLDTNFKSKRGKVLRYLVFYFQLLFHRYKGYDIVYIHNYPYVFMPLIFRFESMKDIVIHWHGTDIFAPSRISRVLNNVSYFFIPRGTKHITPSGYFADQVSKRLKINRSEIFVSPSGGVDTDLFFPVEKQRGDTVILGFASSMKTDKGMDFVLELVENSYEIEEVCGKKIKIHCIEYGAEKEFYKERLLKFNNVKLYEPFPKERMVKFYHEIDILLLTTRMAESLALVGLEAMSCNVPVIGTNDFAIKEYVISGVSGEKFRKGDFVDFQRAVINAIKNLPNYKPRNIVLDNYSKKSVTKQYNKYFANKGER